jgi:hypothetical protein
MKRAVRPRARRDQRGQALIEFALAMPILLILLVGSLTISRGSYDAEIVQESGDEAGKMAAIDRVDPTGNHAYSMTDSQLRDWINASAHLQDSSIALGAITCTSNPGNWKFQGGQTPPGAPSQGSDIYGTLLGIGGSDLWSWLDPSFGTMRVTYMHDLGLSAGPPMPINYVFHFQRYQMTWLPFTAKKGDDHC